MYGVGNTVNNYAVSLYGQMVTRLPVVIVLKCIEILNHCVVKQELPVLQVNYTSKINKGRGNWMR